MAIDLNGPFVANKTGVNQIASKEAINSKPVTAGTNKTLAVQGAAGPAAGNISVNKVGDNLYEQSIGGIDYQARYNEDTGQIEFSEKGKDSWNNLGTGVSLNFDGHTYSNKYDNKAGILDIPHVSNPAVGGNGNSGLGGTSNAGLLSGISSSAIQAPALNYGTQQQYKAEVPKEALVQTQLENITKKDSPLMDLAKQQGMNIAAKRGLLNSSIAAGASQAELVKQALPIAQQDAQAYQSQNQLNQTESNKANLSELNNYLGKDYASFENELTKNLNLYNTKLQVASEKELNKYNAEIEKDLKAYTADLDLRNQSKMANIQLGIDRNLATLNSDLQGGLIKLEVGAKDTMDLVKQQSGLWAQFIGAVGEIQKSDMNVKDKINQIENLEGYTINAVNNIVDQYGFLGPGLGPGDLIREAVAEEQAQKEAALAGQGQGGDLALLDEALADFEKRQKFQDQLGLNNI